MRIVFADTFYFIALGNRTDLAYEKSLAFSQTYVGRVVTTGFVLIELMDGCASTLIQRAAAIRAVEKLRINPHVTIIPCSDMLFQQGVELYENRPDKEWSLTDCISFVVMKTRGISEALTGDRHFEQAGFVTLLKS